VELVEYSPAILDSWVWDKVQATMDMPQASASKASGAGYLLTGLVRCADCGRAVVGCTRVWSKSKKEYKYYRCNCDFVRPGLGVACHAGRISATVLEGVVWEYALGLVANPAGVVEQVLAQAEEGKEDLDAEIDRCKAEVRKCGSAALKS
jgi:site-specific DNA recombinase